jgi:hypothetical protein
VSELLPVLFKMAFQLSQTAGVLTPLKDQGSDYARLEADLAPRAQINAQFAALLRALLATLATLNKQQVRRSSFSQLPPLSQRFLFADGGCGRRCCGEGGCHRDAVLGRCSAQKAPCAGACSVGASL